VSRARPELPPLSGSTVEIPVRFAECDAYGVVWHGHYALYFEQAREALTARYGFTASRALELGYKVPFTRMEVRYRQPILADTTVRVTARLRPPEVARLVLDYEVRDTSGRLLATAETEQVVLNAQGELLLSLPAALSRLVENILRGQQPRPGSA
jgi:acyl-CoA thioester hydrolase